MIASSPNINWTWYLDYDIIEPEVIVINGHYRLHRFNDDGHVSGEDFKLEENKERIVTGATIGNKYYLVANERHIFDY